MRLALIDSDIVAFVVAARAEEKFDFGNGTMGKTIDRKSMAKWCDEIIESHCNVTNSDQAIVCLSDPTVNFRKQFDPTYKSNRKDAVKPELLMVAKEYMYEEYRSFIRPRLEADDVMGILATRPSLLGKNVTDVVIVSEDKDMRTIPARVYNPNHADLGILRISKLDAIKFHLWQVITGDTTDGYAGVKGVGMGGKYEDGTFVEGPRSLGSFAHDCICSTTPLEAWDNVLGAYASKGLTEDDAIHQAILARILWADDYNMKTQGIKLWNPTKLLW